MSSRLSPQQQNGRAGSVVAGCLFAAYALILLLHRAPPSLTDFANWTYQGVLLRNHIVGVADVAHQLKHYPVPNSAVTIGVGVLNLLLPWKAAAKAWLCLQFLLSFLALRHVQRTLGGTWAAWVVGVPAIFLNVNFWYGFVNFQLGLCWVLFIASMLLQRVRAADDVGGAWRVDWRLGGLLLLAFFTHMIPFAFCGLLVMLYALQTRRLRVLWSLLPSGLATVWYALGRYVWAGNADGQTSMETHLSYMSLRFAAYKVDSYLKSFGYVNPAGNNRENLGVACFWVLLVVNLVVAAVVAGAISRVAREQMERGSEKRFLWWGMGILVPLYLLAPNTAFGVSDPGARLLQTGLALALMLCACEAGKSVRVAAAGAVVLALAGVFLFQTVGFGERAQPVMQARPASGPQDFARVPMEDQNYFYGALERGDMKLKVFPTGMFLNVEGPVPH